MTAQVVVPWYRREQIEAWLDAWHIVDVPPWLNLTRDKTGAGCGATKNVGIENARMDMAADDVVVVLDDDCFPIFDDYGTLEEFVALHVAALEPQRVSLMVRVTEPPSRGTPFLQTTVEMPVAASMGYWTEIGDYDAARQLAYGSQQMAFLGGTIAGRYFPLSGMNLAFRPGLWWPWCQFVDVPRFDDIWMGWMWQREAIRRGACFNLDGPKVRHSRQSSVWNNLQVEARYLERNETLWADIATHPEPTYENLTALLPDDPGGSDR